MPELPEVETSCRGIRPHLVGRTLVRCDVRQPKLRWPVSPELQQLQQVKLLQVQRRAKYVLIASEAGWLLLHLGMSGRLRVVPADTPLQKHDHVDLVLDNQQVLRFNDARRFGAVLWLGELGPAHPLLANLGPEPLTDDFNADYLSAQLGKRSSAIKPTLMNNALVVGVGNIYANEALFMVGINPQTRCQQLSATQVALLCAAIKQVLRQAIEQGGTTLKDFTQVDGKPGYFAQQLMVYGRADKTCLKCQTPIVKITQGQRSSFYCPTCQPLAR